MIKFKIFYPLVSNDSAQPNRLKRKFTCIVYKIDIFSSPRSFKRVYLE